MSRPLDHATRLQVSAAELFSAAEDAQRTTQAQAGELARLMHNAEAREHRRAAFNARDKACYRLGGAFEPVHGLDPDPVTLTGFLALGSAALLMLVQVALQRPHETTAGHLARLFRSPAGRVIRAHGVWTRWNWLRNLYIEETETFLNSKKGRDPEARWRSEKPTVNQTYLVAEICLDLQLEVKEFTTRGEAFEWIERRGGNPRFAREPARPELGELAGMLR